MNDRLEYSLRINGAIDGQSNYGANAKVIIEPSRTPFFSLAFNTNMGLLEVAEFLNTFKVPFPTNSVVHSLVGNEAIKKFSDPMLADVAEEMYERPPKNARTFGDLVDLIETQVGVPDSEYTRMVGVKGSEWENAAFVYGSKAANSKVPSQRARQIIYQDRQIVQPRFGVIMNMSPLLSPHSPGYEGRRKKIEKMVGDALLIR